MHKITKGLKKKKKGKKSKHKEDELFKPEELEAYRREHQQQQQAEVGEPSEKAASGENEEWKKFKALTSGVDDILKKTQGDLDRIKSTSFFKRVPTASEVKKQEDDRKEEEKVLEESKLEEERIVAKVKAAIVEVSESESEEEDEEDIFDTTYIDAIAAGDVKLAYIPESPTEEPDDDPFDTSYAEKAILGPNAERKGKKLVPLGSAVEILSGRVQAPTCVPIKRPSTRRQVFKERDLLLGSFDENANADKEPNVKEHFAPANKSNLLDDDAPLSSEPIHLEINLAPVGITSSFEETKQVNPVQDILEEFDVIQKQDSAEEDDEFAQLAAESLSKAPVHVINNLPTELVPEATKDSWNAFGDDKKDKSVENFDDDPFDTTFAENIAPGQEELKQIEKEILDNDDDFDFNPRAEEGYAELIQTKVSIQLINPSGQRESLSSLDRISEDDLNTIKPIHRDLLGGSSTDLSQLGDQPLQPKENLEDIPIEYSDPFDTSIVDTVTLPGCTELKFLEKELLGDIKKPDPAPEDFSDDEFDPRADDLPNLNSIQARKVSFDLPLENKPDLLALSEDEFKASKPLTPYYVRQNLIREQVLEEQDVDPFDTSFVSNTAPGAAELKIIEDELFKPELKHSISDSDFNPRDDTQVAIAKVVQTIKGSVDPTKVVEFKIPEKKAIDLLGVDNDIETKVLTPAAGDDSFEDEYIDPFDTSIACNILPGTTELKLLESELINSATPTVIKRNLTDPEFDPRDTSDAPVKVDLLAQPEATVNVKPLTPLFDQVNFEIGDNEEDFDPFDTSIANNIGPGPSELKLLESEFI